MEQQTREDIAEIRRGGSQAANELLDHLLDYMSSIDGEMGCVHSATRIEAGECRDYPDAEPIHLLRTLSAPATLVAPTSRTQEEKIAFRKAWDARVEAGRRRRELWEAGRRRVERYGS